MRKCHECFFTWYLSITRLINKLTEFPCYKPNLKIHQFPMNVKYLLMCMYMCVYVYVCLCMCMCTCMCRCLCITHVYTCIYMLHCTHTFLEHANHGNKSYANYGLINHKFESTSLITTCERLNIEYLKHKIYLQISSFITMLVKQIHAF